MSNQIRPGTKQIIDSVNKKGIELISIGMNILFSLMAIQSFYTQIFIAYRWLYIVPSISLIMFGKELFGLFMTLKPGIKILIKKPEKPIVNCFADPFDEDYGLFSFIKLNPLLLGFIRPLFYVATCFSNSRAIFSYAIQAKYKVKPCLFNQEILLQKLGNIMVLAFDLIIHTHDENPDLNLKLFFKLLQNVALLIFSHFGSSMSLFQVNDFIEDVSEGKLTEEQTKLGLQFIYQLSTGENIPDELRKNLLCFAKKEEEKEAKKEEKKEDEQEEKKAEVIEEKKKDDEVVRRKPTTKDL